jgi:hypothetical protein
MVGFVQTARKQYDDMGFDTLPLIGGSKNPYPRAWQKRLPNRLWQNAPQDANIGIRGGGLADAAFIDCDNPQAFKIVTNYLAGLGYRGDSYPVVRTPKKDGRHIYITLMGVLSGDARDLSQEVGDGEFRYGAGAFIVAPPSIITEGDYQLLSGDFSIRPMLEVKDVLPILSNREIVSTSKPTLSRKALALLHGKGTDTYSSRSEAEQSLIASMANIGLTFGEVLDFFNRFPCAGKYADLKARNARNAERWLSKSYNEAMQWVKTHESKARQSAKSAIEWAESKAWKGRTGANDQLIYLAHAGIAYKAGRLFYAADCRTLAEIAGISHTAATNSTWRLCKSGLLIPDKKAIADNANIYQLVTMDKPLHSQSSSIVRKWQGLSNHDTFRYGGLGKSAGQVYAALQESPANIDELAEITGRHTKTIERALDRMSKLTDPLTGEHLPMVSSNDREIYHPLPVDLDHIAHALGMAGTGERQRKEHARERRLHRRSLDSGQQSSKRNSPTSGDAEKV